MGIFHLNQIVTIPFLEIGKSPEFTRVVNPGKTFQTSQCIILRFPLLQFFFLDPAAGPPYIQILVQGPYNPPSLPDHPQLATRAFLYTVHLLRNTIPHLQLRNRSSAALSLPCDKTSILGTRSVLGTLS